jgi:hypothetical protein
MSAKSQNGISPEIEQAINVAVAGAYAQATRALADLQSHAFSSGAGVLLVSTVTNTIATLTVTPKVTGKFRVIGTGSIQNGSTTQVAVSFQIQTQTTTGAAASNVLAGPNIELPGTTTGYATPIFPFGLQVETTAGVAQPVGVAGIIALNAIPGTTNLASVLAGAQLCVQEIL